MKFSVISALLLLTSAVFADETIALNSRNTVTFRGEITEESTTTAANQLIALVQKRGRQTYKLYLVLDSPGGDIEAGGDFIELVKTIPNLSTVTLHAASMASAIVQALPGERLIAENGVMMFHRAKGQVSGQFESGELESRLNLYKEIVRAMEQRNADRMKMSLRAYKKAVKDEMWHYGAGAVAKGSADRKVSFTCSKQLLDAKTTQQMRFMIFTIQLEFSACPLMRSPSIASGTPQDTITAYKKYKGMDEL